MRYSVKAGTLDLILECAKDSYPREFAGLLRAENKIITELILLPGTISGSSSALYRLHMRPIDLTIIGSVHSHPVGAPLPSRADLELFAKFGRIHLICAPPFTRASWKAWNYKGEEVEIGVV